jgi:hypothetical protein
MQKTRPKLNRRLVTLNLDNDQAARLDRLAAPRGQKAGDFVADLLKPILEAENGEALNWFTVALNGPDFALLGTLCRKRGWQVDQLLDVLIGDALQHLEGDQP